MVRPINDNREKSLDEAVQRFVDAQLRGEEPDMDEFVQQYPELENQFRRRIRNLWKIDTLLTCLVQADENEFEDTGTAYDLIGQKLGDFEILKMIGRGGMGVVYLARDSKLDRFVAIKSMPAELSDDPTAQRRFQREAKLLASLSHPNIAVIHGMIKQDDGSGYLILEYVAGETLAERIAREPLKLEDALLIGQQIAETISAAHEKGVIHRDLKPSNIKITPEGNVKVLDFGLAKAYRSQDTGQDASVSQPWRVVGTPAYMSPEQARGNPIDHRTDIWSFGCTMYEMLTARSPFTGQTASDVLSSVLRDEPDWEAMPTEFGPGLRDLIRRCLEKDPKRRYQSVAELCQDLVDYQATLTAPAAKVLDVKALLRLLRKPHIAVAGALVFLALCVVTFWLIDRSAKVRWARVEAIPQIIRLVEQYDCFAAFRLAQEAEKYIPKDPTLIELWPRITKDYSIITSPRGANIFFKKYEATDSQWQYLGRSPLENIRFPHGVYRWKIEKEGFETTEYVAHVEHVSPKSVEIELWQEGSLPPGMVPIQGGRLKMRLSLFQSEDASIEVPAFWIDKCEVTNEQFKEFVDHGSYAKKEYWKHKFVKNGRKLSWEEAMSQFRDKTGRPGPSTWEGGTYPAGQEQYPVSGVTWFEAAAYAEFVGKSLPTVYHWSSAACADEAGYIIPGSNFEGKGPAPVGSHPGIGHTGLYDMAGNVREWCLNATSDSADHRYILGGAWNEPSYMFNFTEFRSSWDRSAGNGFRCVQYPDGVGAVPDTLFRPIEPRFGRDYSSETPVSDEVFKVYKRLYDYDPTELNAEVISVDESSVYWRKEEITFDATYGGERIIARLYLPKGVKPPYQTVVYFPGSGPIVNRWSENFRPRVSAIFMGGRALVWPVYKGTFERRHAKGHFPDYSKPVAHRDWVIQLAKDLRRTIDYLQTREDIDHEKIAYYGGSWGARLGPIMLAVEERLKAGVLFKGGFSSRELPPAADPFNFAPRVKAPVLMINGREDFFFPLKTSQIPMYELLGTPAENKKHILYPGAHAIWVLFGSQIRNDIHGWLDSYLGPVD
ncbi:MAG: protein kinase [Sedimentisphaerales bacterium]